MASRANTQDPDQVVDISRLQRKITQFVGRPICRLYSKHVTKNQPADAVLRFLCSIQFWTVYRFWPNLVNPQRFSEKLWRRLLYERDPLFSLITDKLRVREFVAERVGHSVLIPLLWSGNSPEKIPFHDLPSRFVIKANHGAGYNLIVRDKSSLDQSASRDLLNKWIRENYCEDKYLGIEWGYRNIKPAVMIEKYFEDFSGELIDYKFWCFSGRAEVVTVHFDRFKAPKVRTFDRKLEPHWFRFPLDDGTSEIRRPVNYMEMLGVAESLARGFDFIRVDLYCVEGTVYFGELTPYPGGAGIAFLPTEADFALGAKWKT